MFPRSTKFIKQGLLSQDWHFPVCRTKCWMGDNKSMRHPQTKTTLVLLLYIVFLGILSTLATKMSLKSQPHRGKLNDEPSPLPLKWLVRTILGLPHWLADSGGPPPRGRAAETHFPWDSAADSRGYASKKTHGGFMWSLAISAELWSCGYTGNTAPYDLWSMCIFKPKCIHAVIRLGGHFSRSSTSQAPQKHNRGAPPRNGKPVGNLCQITRAWLTADSRCS